MDDVVHDARRVVLAEDVVLGIETGLVKINQTKNNQLLLQSNYKVFKYFILKKDLIKVDSINERVKNSKNRRFIIKLKKNKM